MQSFKTGGSVKNAYCGGGRMKKGGEVESAAEIKQDKALVKKAIAMHDKQEHKGEKTDLSKLKRGGRSKKEVGTVKKYCGGKSVKKMSDGKSTGELPQDLTDRIAREENEADAAIIPNTINKVKEIGKSVVNSVQENLAQGAKEHQAPKPRMNLGKLPGKAADKKLGLDGYDDIEKNNAAVLLRKGFSDKDAKEMAKQKAFRKGGKC